MIKGIYKLYVLRVASNEIRHIDTQHKGLFVTLSINDIQHKNKQHFALCLYAGCRDFLIVTLSIVMLNVVAPILLLILFSTAVNYGRKNVYETGNRKKTGAQYSLQNGMFLVTLKLIQLTKKQDTAGTNAISVLRAYRPIK